MEHSHACPWISPCNPDLTAKCRSEVFRKLNAVTLPPFLLRHGLSVALSRTCYADCADHRDPSASAEITGAGHHL